MPRNEGAAVKRREFLSQSAGVVGLSFVGCGLGTLGACTDSAEASRREVIVDGKRAMTVDIHCHSYVHDVYPLIEGRHELDYLQSVLQNEVLRNKIDIDNIDFRLQQMDQQGIDIQAVSLHVGQYHHWAEAELAREIVAIQNQRIAELCAAHPDRFVGIGAVALQHPAFAVEQMRTAISEYDMRGFMITGSVDGEELSNPRFHPFWAAAEELGTIIFIHPRYFPGCKKPPAGQRRPRECHR